VPPVARIQNFVETLQGQDRQERPEWAQRLAAQEQSEDNIGQETERQVKRVG
jgi:hypothetical protein